MTAASLFVEAVRWWLVSGAVVAALFLTFGIDRIDQGARGAYAFRPLLIPGVLLIWPLVLWCWLRSELGIGNQAAHYRPPRAVHLPAALVLAAALVFAIGAGITVRQTWPQDITPHMLEGPDR